MDLFSNCFLIVNNPNNGAIFDHGFSSLCVTLQSSDSNASSAPKSEGRTIYYHVADESGEVDDDVVEGYSLNFKGNGVDELTKKLKEETGLEDIVVCTRSPLNGKLYPLKLQLPPNNANMHVIVVQTSSKGEFFYF